MARFSFGKRMAGFRKIGKSCRAPLLPFSWMGGPREQGLQGTGTAYCRREERRICASGLWRSDHPHSLDREDHDTQVTLSYLPPLPGLGTRSTTVWLGSLRALSTGMNCPDRASRPLSVLSDLAKLITPSL